MFPHSRGKGQVLGEDDFLTEIRKVNCIKNDSKASFESILEAVCCLLEIKKELILSSSKSQIASFARGLISSVARKEKIPLEEVARRMGRDGSTISSLVSRFSLRFADCSKTEDLIERTMLKVRQIA